MAIKTSNIPKEIEEALVESWAEHQLMELVSLQKAADVFEGLTQEMLSSFLSELVRGDRCKDCGKLAGTFGLLDTLRCVDCETD